MEVPNHIEATHIIYPNQHVCNTEHYLKIKNIDCKHGITFVHWWLYPSSYDEWMPINLLLANPDQNYFCKNPWKIGVQYIVDVEKFNEWTSELDYKIDDLLIESIYSLTNLKKKKKNTQTQSV
jgi:hypothetical protein